MDFGLRQFFLKFEAAHSRQPHIEHEAAWRVCGASRKAFSRAEKLDLEPDRLEKLL